MSLGSRMNSPSETARKYASMQIQTASNSRVICMLHAKCISLIQKASEIQNDQSGRRLLLDRAQNILAELERVLVVDDDLSQGLFYLYDYCYCLLENSEKDSYRQAISILSLLRDTFNTLLRGSSQ